MEKLNERLNLKKLKDSPKKIWRKEFKKKELREIYQTIFDSANEIFGVPYEKWYTKSTADIIKKYGFMMHLETDKYDDLTGIMPETVKNFLESNSMEDFKNVIDKINIYLYIVNNVESLSVNDSNEINMQSILYFDYEDGIKSLECNEVFKFFTNTSAEPTLEERMLAKISFVFGDPDLDKNFWDYWKEYLEKKEDLIVYRDIIKSMEIPVKSFIEKGVELIIEKRKEEWQKIYKRIPQVEELILVNPRNFNFKEHSSLIVKTFEKPLKDLDEDNRKLICRAIDALGKNLNLKFLETFNKEVLFSYFKNFRLSGEEVEYVIDDLLRFKDFPNEDTVEKISTVLYAAKLKKHNKAAYENIMKSFLKRSNSEKTKNMLINFLKYLDSINYKENVINTIAGIEDTYSFFKILNRYTGGNIFNPYSEELIKLIYIYKNRSSEHNIPLISGSIGEYKYGILSKDDPKGLVLGYATDCCQTASGAGASCIKDGYFEPNSGFFRVEKKNNIYAQSWIWQVEVEGIKILVFDSIEFLGNNINQYAIIPAYEETAKELISKYGYDLIIAVSSPNVRLDKDGISWPLHNFKFFNSGDFKDNGYFDFRGSGYILGISKNKKLKEILKKECEEDKKTNVYAYLKSKGMVYKRES